MNLHVPRTNLNVYIMDANNTLVRTCYGAMLFSALVAVVSLSVATYLFLDAGNVSDRTDIKQQLLQFEQRLRDLEANRGNSAKLFPEAHARPPIRQGWIAKVFAPFSADQSAPSGPDLGTFVLDETQFHLQMHEGHAIVQPRVAAYQLLGLYAAKESGRHEISFDLKYAGAMAAKTKTPAHCRVKLKIDGKILIDERKELLPPHYSQSLMVGGIDLRPGLYPAEAIISCDIAAKSRGRDLVVVLKTRPPGANNFAQRQDSFVHGSI